MKNKVCSIEDCNTSASGKNAGHGLCPKHRQQKYRKESKLYKEKCLEWAKSHRNSIKGRFTASKHEAAKRNLSWTFSLEQYETFLETYNNKCHYCNNVISHGGSRLDRIDNTKGYNTKNCVPCCVKCNRLKGEFLTVSETVEILKLLKSMRGENVWEI